MFIVIALNAVLALVVLVAIVGLLTNAIRTPGSRATGVSARVIAFGPRSADASNESYRRAA